MRVRVTVVLEVPDHADPGRVGEAVQWVLGQEGYTVQSCRSRRVQETHEKPAVPAGDGA